MGHPLGYRVLREALQRASPPGGLVLNRLLPFESSTTSHQRGCVSLPKGATSSEKKAVDEIAPTPANPFSTRAQTSNDPAVETNQCIRKIGPTCVCVRVVHVAPFVVLRKCAVLPPTRRGLREGVAPSTVYATDVRRIATQNDFLSISKCQRNSSTPYDFLTCCSCPDDGAFP